MLASHAGLLAYPHAKKMQHSAPFSWLCSGWNQAHTPRNRHQIFLFPKEDGVAEVLTWFHFVYVVQKLRHGLVVSAGMFDNLSRGLDKAWDMVRKDGKLTADNIKGPMREIRRALLEADVRPCSYGMSGCKWAHVFCWQRQQAFERLCKHVQPALKHIKAHTCRSPGPC